MPLWQRKAQWQPGSGRRAGEKGEITRKERGQCQPGRVHVPLQERAQREREEERGYLKRGGEREEERGGEREEEREGGERGRERGRKKGEERKWSETEEREEIREREREEREREKREREKEKGERESEGREERKG